MFFTSSGPETVSRGPNVDLLVTTPYLRTGKSSSTEELRYQRTQCQCDHTKYLPKKTPSVPKQECPGSSMWSRLSGRSSVPPRTTQNKAERRVSTVSSGSERSCRAVRSLSPKRTFSTGRPRRTGVPERPYK